MDEPVGRWLTSLIYTLATITELSGVGTIPPSGVDTREECLRAADLFLDAVRPHPGGGAVEARDRARLLPRRDQLSGNRIEVTTGGRLVDHPGLAAPVVWDGGRLAKGQAWGVKTIDTFLTNGTPPVDR